MKKKKTFEIYMTSSSFTRFMLHCFKLSILYVDCDSLFEILLAFDLFNNEQIISGIQSRMKNPLKRNCLILKSSWNQTHIIFVKNLIRILKYVLSTMSQFLWKYLFNYYNLLLTLILYIISFQNNQTILDSSSLLFSDEPNTLSLQQADQVLFIRVARVCF